MKPIEQVTRQIYPGIEVVPVLQAAGTDAIYLAQSGIPTYGLSGMFVDPDLSNIHGLNERIRVQSLYDSRDFLILVGQAVRRADSLNRGPREVTRWCEAIAGRRARP